MKYIKAFVFFLAVIQTGWSQVTVGIAGLSHSHVLPLLRTMDRVDIKIVGIAESDTALLHRYAKQFSLDKNLLFTSLDEMLDRTKPQGVAVFTSIYDHYKVVEACAPRGIHVMVEKPLAVSNKHVQAMASLINKYHIHLLTNYETTWYPSVYRASDLISSGQLGEIKKIIVYDGHKGPEEIKVNAEFLKWLTDPELNGGGAATDFGCYGADLITWIRKGQKPEYVYAQLKQYKPGTYPNVDDDATIILSYPDMEGVIHASWNWPFNRKDMHIYGTNGYVFADDATTIRFKFDENQPEKVEKLVTSEIAFSDGFSFFAAVISGKTKVLPTELSSFEVNQTVVEILEAARKSNRLGKKVRLKNEQPRITTRTTP